MKKNYFLTVTAALLCTFAASAQSTMGNPGQPPLVTSGKHPSTLPVKAMIEPQVPIDFRKAADQDATFLRAAAQVMQLDSIVQKTPDGSNSIKYAYTYDKSGNTASETTLWWNNGQWQVTGIYLYPEYDSKGNSLGYEYYYIFGTDTILNRSNQKEYATEGYLKKDITNYYDSNKNISSVYTAEYNAWGQTMYETQGLVNGKLIVKSRYVSNYDKEGRRILSEDHIYNEESGKLETSYRYVYDYDSEGRQTKYEYHTRINNELALFTARYYEYDQWGHQSFYKNIERNEDAYNTTLYKYVYDEKGYTLYYEYLYDNASRYSHHITESKYADDHLSGTSIVRDTTIWKDDDSQSISLYSENLTYNKEGYLLTCDQYNLDPETNKQTTLLYTNEYTYDSLNRLIINEFSSYFNGNVSFRNKQEYERPESGNSYIYTYSTQDLETKTWTIEDKQKYEYESDGENTYYYRYSDWDEETQEWVATSGFKQEYQSKGDSYSRIQYNWNNGRKDWVIAYGYRYFNESDGDNLEQYNASYDTNNEAWNINYSSKREVMDDGNPKVIRIYNNLQDDFKTWTFLSSEYHYYSASTVANATIDSPRAAHIYTGKGSIRIEAVEGAAVLAVYDINGKCLHRSNMDGATTISGLHAGIYIVTIDNQQVKVAVK